MFNECLREQQERKERAGERAPLAKSVRVCMAGAVCVPHN
jgi:hypothetical protein